MPVYQYGQTPPAIPGVNVGIVPPANNLLSPAETDILGIVGTATWGPVNAPTPVAGAGDYPTKFGNLQPRTYDAGTPVATASQQGSQSQLVVRVTDTTDVAASALLGLQGVATLGSAGAAHAVNDVLTLANGATIKVNTVTGGAVATFTQLTQPTSKVTGSVAQTSTTGAGTGATFTYVYTQGATAASIWTGSGANGDTISLSPGNQTGTWKITVLHPALPTEVYNNVGFGLTGTALWTAIVAAVNTGTNFRGKSQIMVLTAGTSSAAPVAQAVALAGGTDGASGVTTSMLLGVDTTGARTGMYTLRKSGASVALLSDCFDSTTWATQVAFGLSEGIDMIGVGPQGDTISNATATKASGGIDSFDFTLLFGDWIFWLDTVNQQIRLVSPQGFYAGWVAANGPQFSPLNQELQGILGTQKSSSGTVYQADELTLLEQAGIDVIINPSPGGPYFSAAFGHNSSSSALIRGQNYTRMTNFLAATLVVGAGPYIGRLDLPSTIDELQTELDAFFQDLWDNNVIGTPNATAAPWLCTITPNGAVVNISLKVIYASIIETINIALQGGQTVQITRTTSTSNTGAN